MHRNLHSVGKEMSRAKNVAEKIPLTQPVEDWLRALARQHSISKGAHDVIQAAISRPEFASYASAFDLGKDAGVNTATVTRAAQALGFSGWPELRQEIRARYVGLLTAPELATVHDAGSSGLPFDDALNRQIADLNLIRRSLDRERVKTFASLIAKSNRRVIIACGSFAGVGRILAHHAGIAGYRCEFYDDAVATANGLSDIASGDVVIIITFWRLYNVAITAGRQAQERGATVCLLSDAAISPVAKHAHHVLIVPSEGSSFFPALVPSLSVVEGICAELESVNVEKARQAVRDAEQQWQDFNLLHFNSRPWSE
jgi:DNA-binding MurR/RpiR family transcriptional regulator